MSPFKTVYNGSRRPHWQQKQLKSEKVILLVSALTLWNYATLNGPYSTWLRFISCPGTKVIILPFIQKVVQCSFYSWWTDAAWFITSSSCARPNHHAVVCRPHAVRLALAPYIHTYIHTYIYTYRFIMQLAKRNKLHDSTNTCGENC